MITPRFEDEFGATYILIEPGDFQMGDSVGDGLARELPVHNVTIDNPFFIGQRPVTQVHWASPCGRACCWRRTRPFLFGVYRDCVVWSRRGRIERWLKCRVTGKNGAITRAVATYKQGRKPR